MFSVSLDINIPWSNEGGGPFIATDTERAAGKLRWIPLVCLILSPILMYRIIKIPMGNMKKINDDSS